LSIVPFVGFQAIAWDYQLYISDVLFLEISGQSNALHLVFLMPILFETSLAGHIRDYNMPVG